MFADLILACRRLFPIIFFQIWSLRMCIIYYFPNNNNILCCAMLEGINPKQTKEQQVINATEKWC